MQSTSSSSSASSPRHYSKMWPHPPGGGSNNGATTTGTTTTTTAIPAHEDYRNARWYWGSITKDQVHTILVGKPDGSFIVRDASSKNGDLTLTLTKDGTLFLIRILHCNGMYGFSDCNYSSVVELIEFYMHNSLEVYNKDLNITLSNPVLRYDVNADDMMITAVATTIGGSSSGGGVGGVVGGNTTSGGLSTTSNTNPLHELMKPVEQFLDTNKQLTSEQQNLDEKWRIFKLIEMELEEKRLHQDIFMRAEKMLKQQLRVLESYLAGGGGGTQTVGSPGTGGGISALTNNNQNIMVSSPGGGGGGGVGGTNNASNIQRAQERDQLKRNVAKLHERIDSLLIEMDKLNATVEKKKENYRKLERQINTAKPAINSLASTKEGLCEYLKAKGLKDEDLKDMIRMGAVAWFQHYQSTAHQPHSNELMWFLKDCTRADAEQWLHEAPTGTFLIRARPENYALSIVCNDCVNHCIVYQEESGYGFAAPYNIYATLKDLVKHYSTNSLEEHNDTLTTTLRIPVLHWHYNRDAVLQQLQMEEMQAAAEAAAEEAEVAFNIMNAQQKAAKQQASSGVGGGQSSHIYEVIYDDQLMMPPPPPPPPMMSPHDHEDREQTPPGPPQQQ